MTTRLLLAIASVSMMIGFAPVLAPLSMPHQLPTCNGAARAMARLELLFGSSRMDGTIVSDAEWQGFLDSEVTPRFPAGLTVLSGPGQWRDRSGNLVREGSQMLVIWYDPSPGAHDMIEAIRAAYKMRFAQESVMRVDSASCVSF